MPNTRSRPWTFITAHGMVVIYVSQNPRSTVRKISDDLGITERQVARILKQLAEEDVLKVQRTAGRNSYVVNADAPLRRQGMAHVRVGQFVDALSAIIAPPS